jgi:hypothetical protein
MRVFNENKTEELKEYDLEKGYLKADKIFVKHHEAIQAVEEQGHYETIAEYPNGGKEVKWVVDVVGVVGKEGYDEYEDIQVFIPYTLEETIERKKEQLRAQREKECFSVINRGKLWYKQLSYEQERELELWYNAWLNATETLTIPERPNWVDKKIINDTEVL